MRRAKFSAARHGQQRPLATRRKKNLQDRLLRWYLSARRPLPWRNTRAPYDIWISEVMLQQTQTAKVLEYYEKFLRQFPDIHALAAASLAQVLKAWEGLGYYARARNLHRAARHLVEHGQGKIPSDYDRLLEISGIGPYTAAAVASIAFNRDHAVVDGNVERVLSRIFLVHLPPKSPAAKPLFRQLAQDFLLSGQARNWNQALMELGALLCTPKKPRCEECPAQNYCGAHLELDNPELLPRRLEKAPRPHYDIAVGLVWKKGLLLIDQRPEKGLLGGLWEFPGGKIAPGQSPAEALHHRLRETLAVEITVGKKFMQIEHGYTHYTVTLQVYSCRYRRGKPSARGCQAWQWIKPGQLHHLAFSTANRKIIAAIMQKENEKEQI